MAFTLRIIAGNKAVKILYQGFDLTFYELARTIATLNADHCLHLRQIGAWGPLTALPRTHHDWAGLSTSNGRFAA